MAVTDSATYDNPFDMSHIFICSILGFLALSLSLYSYSPLSSMFFFGTTQMRQ